MSTLLTASKEQTRGSSREISPKEAGPRLTRRRFLSTSAGAAAALSSGSLVEPVEGKEAAGVRRPGASERPNILFIISDQWSAVASDGSGQEGGLETPVTDKLASQGVRFSRAYSSFPLCSPARVSMFTGRMPFDFSVGGNIHRAGRIPEDVPTLGRLFADAGYDTGYFGKEHVGEMAWRGFKEFGSMKFGGGGYLADGSAFDPVFVRDAVEFIHRPRKNPFLAVVSLINPHDINPIPFMSQRPVAGLTFADTISPFRGDKAIYLRGKPLPELLRNHDAPVPEMMGRRPDWLRSESEWRMYLATYHLLIENTDWLMGELLKALQAAGLEEDTLVVFTSDHGEMMGAHRLVKKNLFFEESARVPFICSWPGKIEAGKSSSELISTLDLLPTLCDYAGIEPPGGLLGSSLRPLLGGTGAKWREYLVAQLGLKRARMVLFDSHKYIKYRGYEALVYDTEKDPLEHNPIEDFPRIKNLRRKGLELLREWTKTSGDPFLLEQPVKRPSSDE